MRSATTSLHILVGSNRDACEAALNEALAARDGARVIEAPPSFAWPFLCPLVPPLEPDRTVIVARDLHEAFVNRQQAGTRLVTTQPAYLLEVWLDALAQHGDATLVATCDSATIRDEARELLHRRGVFTRTTIVEVDAGSAGAAWETAVSGALPLAFRAADLTERLRLAVEALDAGRAPAALIAAASVCMEANDLDAAARDLHEALAQVPDCPAALFESGKLCLRREDMEGAAAAFAACTARLPGFVPAWGNLGGALGELDRPMEALAAFERAREVDPESHHIHNNIGVVTRELGRLADSEAAFRKVIALVPDLAFGHYNLGHTLFLQGRYHAALSAYAEGRKRDADRNAVQASRLAMCRLATGDARGALTELERAFQGLPREFACQLAADTDAIVWALAGQRPDLDGWMTVHEWLARKQQEGRA